MCVLKKCFQLLTIVTIWSDKGKNIQTPVLQSTLVVTTMASDKKENDQELRGPQNQQDSTELLEVSIVVICWIKNTRVQCISW